MDGFANNYVSDAELLRYLKNNGTIFRQEIEKAYQMDRKTLCLEKHDGAIWKGENGLYNTYLKINGKRKRIRRKKLEDLADIIAKHYGIEEVRYEDPTVDDLYAEWMADKMERGEIAMQTKNRYDRVYNRCFVDIGKRRIVSLTQFEVEEFLLQSIHKYSLTVKGYAGLRTLVYGIFRRAKRKSIIDYSITELVKNLEVSNKAFRREYKDVTQLVFNEDETNAMLRYLLEHHDNPKDLGILLLFKTGLRPGELAALRPCDIGEDCIHVRGTEIRYIDEKGIEVYEVRDMPKTEAGIRDVFLPQRYWWILDEIRNLNPDGDYCFKLDGRRVKVCQFDDRLRYLCTKLNIPTKSLNKIRKTYATILLDSNVEESVITAQLGHTDITTTKRYYYKLRKSRTKRAAIMDGVIGL